MSSNGNNGNGNPGKGRGPPENPGSRGERFGDGQEYTCPDCGEPVTFTYDNKNEVPEGGWKNLILSSDEYSIVATGRCTSCDWKSIKRVEVHDLTR